jgi:hypothetical protein
LRAGVVKERCADAGRDPLSPPLKDRPVVLDLLEHGRPEVLLPARGA